MKIGKWIAAGLSILCGAASAVAQDYPNRPVTMVVPFAAALVGMKAIFVPVALMNIRPQRCATEPRPEWA